MRKAGKIPKKEPVAMEMARANSSARGHPYALRLDEEYLLAPNVRANSQRNWRSNGEHAAGEAQQESLCQHLANEARVSCPQGGANCSLAHTAGNAREQQTREIGTHDKEHSHNGGKQKDQSMARWSDDFGFQRQERAQEIDTLTGLSSNL